MNTTKLITAVVLAAGVSTFAFAGPSPQFWAQQEKARIENQARIQAKAPPAAQDQKTCGNCACCAMKKS